MTTDGGTMVMHPNRRLKKEDESEAAFCKRVCDEDQKRLKSLANLPSFDIDRDDLPPRHRMNDQGQKEMLRDAWTVQDGKIIFDEARMPLHVAPGPQPVPGVPVQPVEVKP